MNKPLTSKSSLQINQVYNAESLPHLEHNVAIIKFFNSLNSSFIDEKWSYSLRFNPRAIRLLHDAILAKNLDSDCPISNAAYSSLSVFRNFDNEYKIYAGANVDPKTISLLKDTSARNCAEKQAIELGVRENNLRDDLNLLFLYRRGKANGRYSAEKLLPCLDCYQKYVKQLIKNDGKLIIFLNNSHQREFFNEDAPFYNDPRINKLVINEQKNIYYRIFSSEELKYLKYEKSLGASFQTGCANH
jgi:hypothetical protein